MPSLQQGSCSLYDCELSVLSLFFVSQNIGEMLKSPKEDCLLEECSIGRGSPRSDSSIGRGSPRSDSSIGRIRPRM